MTEIINPKVALPARRSATVCWLHPAIALGPRRAARVFCVVLAGAALLQALPARADSLRCNGRIVAVGDSRISVFHKCGEPLLRDSHCAALYHPSHRTPVPEPFASALLPCQQIDDWLYDRGAGNLYAMVRFRGGIVQSIRYGGEPP